ncbi:aldehyde dehydrogenase family protein [Streptomyces sp. WAC 00631]|uniref:aldehyde dehydrogenase family protein n=1 Tax=unclassified Streptomyces TaxID=2593676 RepID=UPI000F780087|nr:MULTISPECIES: aldehyde dehydrogenase family protein [unclassified Streptomyces]MCC5036537.1 aldehyde dehydrogenase family protein [Streptomyces sp. WAC 00631]MCC9738317.1 aldehyde dehydrogenase family protein [Streptomyces sp. MNU89]
MTPQATPADPAVFTSRNPADPSDTVIEFPGCGEEAVIQTVQRARQAQAEWLGAGVAARSEALCKAADAIERAADEMTGLVIREVGKPLAEARAELASTVSIWRYYSQVLHEPSGALHEPAAGPGVLLTRRRPLGTAGLITPWNFPLAIPSSKAAPALAAGNAVILKPAPEATACALHLAETLGDVLPDGLLRVVPGGPNVGEALVQLADVVSFTGSTAVGKAVVRTATACGTPVQAEMGGRNAAIVLPDADIPQAAAHIAAAIAGYAGQKYTATSQVIAVGSAREPLRDALAERLGAMTAADPGSASTICGPVISLAARHRVAEMRMSALAAGARLLAGGADGQTAPRNGWYVNPTLLEAVPDGHELLEDVVFGPIAVLQEANGLDQAVHLANAGRQGLVTSLHTTDLESALYGSDHLEASMVGVNAPTTGVAFPLPLGGTEGSGHGPHEQGRAALDFYTSQQTISLLPGGSWR